MRIGEAMQKLTQGSGLKSVKEIIMIRLSYKSNGRPGFTFEHEVDEAGSLKSPLGTATIDHMDWSFLDGTQNGTQSTLNEIALVLKGRRRIELTRQRIDELLQQKTPSEQFAEAILIDD